MTQDLYTLLGLKFNPFTPASSSDNYYFTQEASQILEELHYGIASRKGFLLLLGEVGVGKTSLLLQLLKNINKEESLETAWIFNTSLDQKEFLRAIAEDFGLETPSKDNLSNIISILHQYFLEVNQRQHNCAIIVDEAHNLSFEALEALRMLSNLEGNGTKLVQILLTGQPELDTKLKQPELRQLRSRIQLFKTLHSLNQKDTAHYVHYKLNSAESQLRLTKGATKLLFTVTIGNPRMIHLIMDRVLHMVAHQNVRNISSKYIFQASSEIAEYHYGIKQKLRWHKRKQYGLAGAILIVCLVILISLPIWPLSSNSKISLWQALGPNSNAKQNHVLVKRIEKKHIKTNSKTEKPKNVPVEQGSPKIKNKNPEDSRTINEKATKNNETTKNSQALSQTVRKKLQDFLNVYNLDSNTNRLLEAVQKKDIQIFNKGLPDNFAAFSLKGLPPKKLIKYSALSWRELTGKDPKWLVLWKPLLKIEKKFPNNSSEKHILMFQKMLTELGYYKGAWDGQFGTGTYNSMEEFQKANNIPRTHGPDPRTLFWLCIKYEQLKDSNK